MKLKFHKYLFFLGLGAVLTACSNYGLISENDVYFTKPTELALVGDASDITSYGAYKAKEEGNYQEEYINTEERKMNRWSSMSFSPRFSYPFGGYGYFNNYYGNAWMAPSYGMGHIGFYNSLHGYPSYYGYYPPYYAYNSYGVGGYYMYRPNYYSPNYYGPNYYNSIPVFNGSADDKDSYNTVFHRKRRPISSSSNQGNVYQPIYQNNFSGSTGYYNNDETSGTSRRAAGMGTSGGSNAATYSKIYQPGNNYSSPQGQNSTFSQQPRRNISHSSSVISRRRTFTPSTTVRKANAKVVPRGNARLNTQYNSSWSRSGISSPSSVSNRPSFSRSQNSIQSTPSRSPSSSSTSTSRRH